MRIMILESFGGSPGSNSGREGQEPPGPRQETAMSSTPIFGALDYHWYTTSRRNRWFLSAPGTGLDHLPLTTGTRSEALDVVRQVNAVRRKDGLPNVYVRGI